MHSLRRSCQSALQSSNALCPFANGSRRTFSRSTAHQRGALPVFLPASSPELTTLLSTLNARVLLPEHLTKEQQKLVFRPENKAKVEAEPIEITLGDVTLPLEHLDRFRDLPRRWKQLFSIIHASKTTEDWENVLRAVEGFENASIRLKLRHKQLVVRKLNEAGMQHLVLKALQRPGATGLRLRQPELVLEVLRGVHDKAALADWDKAALTKALSMAEQIVEMMEDKEHLARPTVEGEADCRGSPAVIAAPLELAAELAYRHDGDVGKVRKLAGRLMVALGQHKFVPEAIETSRALATKYRTPYEESNAMVRLAQTLSSLVPVWNSLSTARTVLDADMPMPEKAESTQREIREALDAGVKALETLGSRGGKPMSSYVGYVQDAIRRCEDTGEEE